MTKHVWTPDGIRALGVRTDVQTAAEIFGLSRGCAYDLCKRGEFPVPVIKIGDRYLVPTAPILRLLEIEPRRAAKDPWLLVYDESGNPAVVDPHDVIPLTAVSGSDEWDDLARSLARDWEDSAEPEG